MLDRQIANGRAPETAACAETSAPPAWSRLDTTIVLALLLAAGITRLWNLGAPAQLVFDEQYTVVEARCYLHALPYADVHPPLPSLCIALSIFLFGDNSWAWRLPGAILGVALVAITYLLGRRMFNSRLSAALAAALIMLDGLFLVDSRTALWEIFYITFAAAGYLMLFRWLRESDPYRRRAHLAWIGIAMGLAMGSKFLIPGAAILLVWASILFVTYSGRENIGGFPVRQTAATFAVIGGLSGLVYLAIFLPNYWFGWWRGVGDQITYFLRQFQYQEILTSTGSHTYSSRWWSWPLMLRPILYWTKGGFFRATDNSVAEIRALGNPAIWWAIPLAIPFAASRAIFRRSFAHAFLVAGYLLFIAMWIPIRRYQFVYYYMPALYLGALALADLLSRCWSGEAHRWEHLVPLASVSAILVFGMGTAIATVLMISIAAVYLLILLRGGRDPGFFVCGLYLAAVLVCFGYFFPVWTGLPMSAAAFKSRMWLHGPGVANWI